MPDALARARSAIDALGLIVSPGSGRCPGCGATVPAVPNGPVHRSIGASPGCWALYTALLASEFSTFDARVHQLSVDTYAAQHPGAPSPQTVQSVCTHLVALCLSLERGFDVEALRPLLRDLARGRWFEARWLEPPARPFPMTIVDLLESDSPEAYGAGVRQWAGSTWEAWSAHHAQVRAWADLVASARR
jgi:hypothetical protein